MIRAHKASIASVAAGLAILAVPATAQDGSDYFQLGTGIDYSSGDYGEVDDTTMLAVPVSARLQSGDFSLRASVNWLSIKGPDGVIPGDGGVTPGSGAGTVSRRSGIGDVNLAATYSLPVSDTTYFDITGKVKLPTADEAKFLGTGTTDFTAQGELSQVFGNVTVSARGGRRFNGSNALYQLEDAWLAGAGVYVRSGDTTIGLDYDWREGSLPTSPDRSEATASVTHALSPAVRLQGYGYTGFSDGSPDIGGGMQLLYRFGL
jgi:hypothetical protein